MKRGNPSITKAHSVSSSFQKRADSAAFWEAWVTAIFTRGGLYVQAFPFVIDGKDHSQTWDLTVWAQYSPNIAVEVKSVNVSFTGPEDYPYNSVLLCSHNSFRKKWGKSESTLRNFFIVSRVTGAILWVPIDTEIGMTMVTDKERGETYKAVTVHKENLKTVHDFIDMVQNNMTMQDWEG